MAFKVTNGVFLSTAAVAAAHFEIWILAILGSD
jgi:hypothetical protein